MSEILGGLLKLFALATVIVFEPQCFKVEVVTRNVLYLSRMRREKEFPVIVREFRDVFEHMIK